MRKICVINQKGGVGKTTTALNLAAGISRFDKKVLLIDLDPHSNVELSINLENSYTTYDFLFDGIILSECINSIGHNLDILRGDSRLLAIDNDLTDQEFTAKTRERLEMITGYDFVIFDCAPSMSLLNRFFMLHSKEVILPTMTDPLGYDGLKSMIKFIESFSDFNETDIRITKIVPTLYDRRNKVCNTILEKINNEFYELVSSPIRINSKLKEAPMNKQSIFSYAPKSSGAEDYLALVQGIIGNDEEPMQVSSGNISSKILGES